MRVRASSIAGRYSYFVADVLDEFKRRHDAAIHAAAGLRLPTADERAAIARLDHECLATEHRDFHRPSARKWFHQIAGVLPFNRRSKWGKPDKTAEELLAAFRRYLPALAGEGPPSLIGG